jgi:hypothetical protein
MRRDARAHLPVSISEFHGRFLSGVNGIPLITTHLKILQTTYNRSALDERAALRNQYINPSADIPTMYYDYK